MPCNRPPSRFDPAKIVAPFELLKVKKGYALRAYQFREEANGNGVVWAMPENAGFPEPKECPAPNIPPPLISTIALHFSFHFDTVPPKIEY